jgi:hypothetical protein
VVDERDGRCTNTCAPPVTCADPTRTLFAGGPLTDACRQFDGDQSSCEIAWHVGGGRFAAPCFVVPATGECRGCGPTNELAGRCENTCAPPVVCQDPSLAMAGGPGSCGGLDEAACAGGWEVTALRIPASCFFDGAVCRPCTVTAEADGLCTDTCRPAAACDDPSRDIFAGGIGSEACRQFDGDEASCARAWETGAEGGAASCVFTVPCRGCGPPNEARGDCTNTCGPVAPATTCDLDPSRTIFAGGPDTGACGSFDDEPVSCEDAWHLGGFGGAASCFVARLECLGCDPANEALGRCVNTCPAE